MSTSALPLWQSHKKVRAAPISSVTDTELMLRTGAEIGDTSNPQIVIVLVRDNLFARYRPVVGDYYVVYDDGYASISPKKAFEEGYTRVKG